MRRSCYGVDADVARDPAGVYDVYIGLDDVDKLDRLCRERRLGPEARELMSRYSSIASRMFSSTSSMVSPWLWQPGREGTSATYPPVSSSSMTTSNS